MIKPRILILEDDFDSACILQAHLEYESYLVEVVRSISEAKEWFLVNDAPNIALLDVMLPDGSGIEILEYCTKNLLDTACIVITAASSVQGATQAIRKGAFDYVSKPVDFDRLSVIIAHALEKQRLLQEKNELEKKLSTKETGLVFVSQEMKEVMDLVFRFAPSDSTVLVTGESGTGKEVIARKIHEKSGRSKKPYIVVDCTSLSENFLESELFGHMKGSFTGATSTKTGLLKEADGGTVFLDEFGEIPLNLQTKLLRFLQEKEFRPIGSNQIQKVDVRVILATNRDLVKAVHDGHFRKDLFFRINSCNIHLPPLRRRKIDVIPLVEHFIEIYAKGRKFELTEEIRAKMMEHDWPGNVRELQHRVENMVLMANGPVLKFDISATLSYESGKLEQVIDMFLEKKLPFCQILNQFEMALLQKAMERAGGNISKASVILQMNRTTLSKKLSRLESGG